MADNAGASEFGGDPRDNTSALDPTTRAHRALIQSDPNSPDEPGKVTGRQRD